MLDFLATYATPPPPPGVAAFDYSNLGVGLLGHILERTFEKSWEQLVADVITGPKMLDMPDTVCNLTPELRRRLVQGMLPKWTADQWVRTSLLYCVTAHACTS